MTSPWSPLLARWRRDARVALVAVPLIVPCFLSAQRAGAPDALIIWNGRPAHEWVEALPVGNGRLGAMVFGGMAHERIQFNESTLWAGGPHDYSHPGAAGVLDSLRTLLFAGRQRDADALASARAMSLPLKQMPFQAFGELRIAFTGFDSSRVTGYRRSLDLDRAVATTRFMAGDVTYTREVFATHPDGVIVVRLSADRPKLVNLTVALSSAHAGAAYRAVDGGTLAMSGGVAGGAIRFEARLAIRTEGGRLTMHDSTAVVSGATAVTFVLAGATNFVNYTDVSGDPVARNERTLSRLRSTPYPQLLARHLADHRALFRRVELDLGSSDSAAQQQPTPTRVERFASQRDPALVTLLFQHGRYLLIASSRAGGQPATLQGLWNESNTPPWARLAIVSDWVSSSARHVRPPCHRLAVTLASDPCELVTS